MHNHANDNSHMATTMDALLAENRLAATITNEEMIDAVSAEILSGAVHASCAMALIHCRDVLDALRAAQISPQISQACIMAITRADQALRAQGIRHA